MAITYTRNSIGFAKRFRALIASIKNNAVRCAAKDVYEKYLDMIDAFRKIQQACGRRDYYARKLRAVENWIDSDGRMLFIPVEWTTKDETLKMYTQLLAEATKDDEAAEEAYDEAVQAVLDTKFFANGSELDGLFDHYSLPEFYKRFERRCEKLSHHRHKPY